MSVEAVVHRLICDGCHAAWISPVALTPTEARLAVRHNGWTVVFENLVTDVDYCPRCSRNRAHDPASAVGGAGS